MKFIFLVLVCCSIAGFGQTAAEKKIAARPANQQYDLQYDKFKDQTQITSPRFTTNQIDKPKIFLGVGVTLYATSPGKTLSPDTEFWLAIISTSTDWTFRDVTSVIALADGTRHEMEVVDRDTGAGSTYSGAFGRGSPTVTDEIYMKVSRATLRRLLSASHIEIQAGRIEFALHEPSVTVFRNMLAATEK
jgi:hypothetical protein